METEIEEPPFNARKAWTVSTVVVLGIFMSMLDSTVTTVALPTVMNVFGVGMTSIQWLTTAYTLSMAVVVPLGPYLSRVFGAEGVFLASLIVFTCGSFLCGFSQSLDMLILFRILQALGGGIMMPIGMGIVMQLFPPSHRGLALGVFGVAMMAAPAFGPTIGGFIVDSLGWRYVFYVNVPIGIAAVLLGFVFFDFVKRQPFPRFDIAGFVSSAIGSGFLLYLLGKADSIDWTNPTYVYIAIAGVGALVFFIVNEIFRDDPLLDLRLLKNRNYSVSLILVTVQQLMMMSVMYTTPIFLQNFRGLTAMQSGEVMLIPSLVMALLMPVAGRVTDIVGEKGTKWVVAAGIVISGSMTLILSTKMTLGASITDVVLYNSLRNIGMGMSMMPVMTLGLFSIPLKDSQNATALQRFIQQFSSSMSTAIVTYMVTSRFNVNYAGATAQLTPFNLPFMAQVNAIASQLAQAGMSAANATQQAMISIVTQLYEQNYVLAIQFTIFLTAIIGIGALVMVPIFKIDKIPAAETNQVMETN